MQFDNLIPDLNNSVNIYNFNYLFSALQENIYENQFKNCKNVYKHMRHKEVEDFIDRFLEHCNVILEKDNVHCLYLVGIDINSRSGEAGALQYLDYLLNQIKSDDTLKCDLLTQIGDYHGWGSYWYLKPNIPIIDFGVKIPESLNIKQKTTSNCVRVVIKLTRNYIKC